MKNVKLLAAAGMLSLVSFASFAHPVSVTADTLDSAEAKIATIAKEQGASYHITEAYTGNQVHMTAELSKQANGCRGSCRTGRLRVAGLAPAAHPARSNVEPRYGAFFVFAPAA